MSKPKVKNIKILKDTKYLKLYDAEYINKVGNTRHWSIASRKSLEHLNDKFFSGKEDKIDAVIIVPVHIKENKLVLVKQFRIPINDYVYELPAGLVDSGEEFHETVKRELKEETGLDLVKIDYENSKDKVYVSTGMTDESVAMVYCTCEGNTSKDYLEEDEDIEVILVSKKEAKSLIKSDKKMDVKTLMAMQKFILE
ncbi:NUDIX hydrolase [Haloimpatiens sp. FM7315]|uniref:NUDIX hydrolase n=1 Tax=Haloimpatiens sp. FM7315 TaxID=3298609 RepID=UPI003977DDD1